VTGKKNVGVDAAVPSKGAEALPLRRGACAENHQAVRLCDKAAGADGVSEAFPGDELTGTKHNRKALIRMIAGRIKEAGAVAVGNDGDLIRREMMGIDGVAGDISTDTEEMPQGGQAAIDEVAMLRRGSKLFQVRAMQSYHPWNLLEPTGQTGQGPKVMEVDDVGLCPVNDVREAGGKGVAIGLNLAGSEIGITEGSIGHDVRHAGDRQREGGSFATNGFNAARKEGRKVILRICRTQQADLIARIIARADDLLDEDAAAGAIRPLAKDVQDPEGHGEKAMPG